MIENINDNIRGSGAGASPRTPCLPLEANSPGLDERTLERTAALLDGCVDSSNNRSPDDKDSSFKYKRSRFKSTNQLEIIEESDSQCSSSQSDQNDETGEKNESN